METQPEMKVGSAIESGAGVPVGLVPRTAPWSVMACECMNVVDRRLVCSPANSVCKFKDAYACLTVTRQSSVKIISHLPIFPLTRHHGMYVISLHSPVDTTVSVRLDDMIVCDFLLRVA